MKLGIMFNIIDSERGAKADLVPLSREPEYQDAFNRRIKKSFKDEAGHIFDAWCARPEDIIIGKLMAWNEGRSNKHPNDITAMLIFDFAGLSDITIDLTYVTQRASNISSETLQLWQKLIEQSHNMLKTRK